MHLRERAMEKRERESEDLYLRLSRGKKRPRSMFQQLDLASRFSLGKETEKMEHYRDYGAQRKPKILTPGKRMQSQTEDAITVRENDTETIARREMECFYITRKIWRKRKGFAQSLIHTSRTVSFLIPFTLFFRDIMQRERETG